MSKTIFDKLRSRKGLLSPTALAEIINFKVSTLQRRRSKKQRPSWIALSQNRVAYDPSEVADWLESLSSSSVDEKTVHTRVPYEQFGLTYEEYHHAYDSFHVNIYRPDCTCKGCESPIYVDQHSDEEGSWCHVLYFDGDEGVALFEQVDEMPCYSGNGFSMKLFSQYCEIPNRHMKQIIKIFEAFEDSEELSRRLQDVPDKRGEKQHDAK